MEALCSVFFNFAVVVKDNERAFLTRNGRFQRLIGPGRFEAFDPRGQLRAEKYKVVRQELDADTALMFERTEPALASEHFVIVQPGPKEVAIVSLDGEPKHLISPNTTRAFWKTLTRVDVELIDTAAELRLSPDQIAKLDLTRSPSVVHETVAAHERGLLFVDGDLREQLAPGRYAFWNVAHKVRVQRVDMRPTPLEVTAQEILTKDRVAIRVTLTAFYKVIDAERAALSTGDMENTLYRLVQFAIREAVATRTLDEILAARDTIDGQVRAYVSERTQELGISIGDIGVKDVILPGDVRELLNKVVEAERVAKANLIRRQEETAATRSLLNTSRLMEDNPLLLRLKELEALEKLVEKVGRIDLHAGNGGGGLDTLLNKLYRLDGGKDGSRTPPE